MSTSAVKSTAKSESSAEEFARVMMSRRSIRAYLSNPVDDELLHKLFTLAANAPSNCNSQPWLVHVVSGARRDAMSAALIETIGQGKHQLDFPYEAKYDGVYRQRQIAVAKLLFQALGVARDDKEGRKRSFLRNLQFFDAPHAAFIFMPEWGGVREAVDVGMYAQNLMLTLQAHGIASCPQTLLGYNADVVRQQLNIDPDQKLLFGLSFGYEDVSRAENQICPERAELSEATKFYR